MIVQGPVNLMILENHMILTKIKVVCQNFRKPTQSKKQKNELKEDYFRQMNEVSDLDTESESEDKCQEASNEYKVYDKMSSTLSKVSKKVRKDKETSKSLDKLKEQLKDGEFHAGRGAKKLSCTKSVFYMRAGNRARLFFRYSNEEKGAVEMLAESNKDKEQEVIDNLKQNYK